MKKSLVFQIFIFSLFCVILFTSCFPGARDSYTITLNSNGGTVFSAVEIGNGENSVSLPTPERDGFVFLGWFTSNAFNESWSQYLTTHDYTITSNMTLYAKWAPVSGEITLNVNGGDPFPIGTSPVQYAEGVETALPIPTRTGNSFVGWYDAASYTASNQITDESGIMPADFESAEDDFDVYAHWAVKVNIEPYEEAGSVNTGRGYYIIGGLGELDSLTFSATPSANYTFVQWEFGEDIITTNPYSHDFTEDIEISAVFQGAESTLSANPNYSGGITEEYTVHYGETFTVAVPSYPGHVFNGWYTHTVGGTKISDRRGLITSYPYTASTTLYAQWQEGDFTTDFEYEGVGSPATSYKITGYAGEEEIIYIPYELGGIPVTEITDAFNAAGYEADKIIIPSSITSIGASAFSGYTGNIYIDRGYEDLMIVNSPTFSASHNIYVHGTYVVDANISTNPHSNNFSSGNSSLIDDIYFDFLGNFADSNIGSAVELQALMNYLIVYSVPNEIAFYVDTDNLAEAMSGAIQNTGYYRSNTLLDGGSVPYTYSDKKVLMPGFEEKVTRRMASETTDNPGTLELEGFISSYTEDIDPETRVFAIDSMNPYVVYNSEQLVYALESGFKPVFLEESEVKTLYNDAKSILEEIIPAGADTYEKLTIIHDWIALNNVYDHELLNLSTGGTSSDELLAYDGFYLEGLFKNGKAVCDGISKAFMMMCRIEGIEVVRVSGTTVQGDQSVGHAWNKVKIMDKWYGVDLTGDDVSISTSEDPLYEYYEILTHRFFLIPDSLMAYKNIEDPDEENPFYVYHSANGSYDYFVSTNYDEEDNLYIQTQEEQGKVEDAFTDFVNSQESGKYAIELVFYGAHESTINYYSGFSSVTHTNPAQIGLTGKYFVVLMVDKE
jgi:uncharacterized repeat protein (TIGR02543 family)